MNLFPSGSFPSGTTGASTSFTDAGSIDPWAQAAVATAVQDGLVHGYRDGSFRPLGYATTAEAVTIIAGLMKWRPFAPPSAVPSTGYAKGTGPGSTWVPGRLQGITPFYDAARFGPDDLITRE